MPVRAEIIYARGTKVTVSLPHLKTFGTLYGLLECYLIEPVYLHDKRVMLVDEEGLLRKKPINHAATAIAGRLIVGDVAIIAGKDFK